MTAPSAPAFSLRSRHGENKNVNDSPGPGAYILPERAQHGLSISGRWAEKETTESPGPGAYDARENPGQKTAPAFSLRSRHQETGAETAGPGPAAYSPDRRLTSKSAPMYSLSGRWAERGQGNDAPGPGNYSPQYETSTARYISLNSRSQRPGDAALAKAAESPGPCDY